MYIYIFIIYTESWAVKPNFLSQLGAITVSPNPVIPSHPVASAVEDLRMQIQQRPRFLPGTHKVLKKEPGPKAHLSSDPGSHGTVWNPQAARDTWPKVWTSFLALIDTYKHVTCYIYIYVHTYPYRYTNSYIYIYIYNELIYIYIILYLHNIMPTPDE